jgi:hypothetical protein
MKVVEDAAFGARPIMHSMFAFPFCRWDTAPSILPGVAAGAKAADDRRAYVADLPTYSTHFSLLY